MTDAQILTSLKTSLGITVTAYDARLQELISSAKADMIAEGASTLDPSADIGDAQLVIMHAQWQWTRRDSMEAMPRMLRWKLNNRIFAEKMR